MGGLWRGGDCTETKRNSSLPLAMVMMVLININNNGGGNGVVWAAIGPLWMIHNGG